MDRTTIAKLNNSLARPFPIAAWGETAYIKPMPHALRVSVFDVHKENPVQAMALVVQACLCDEKGKRLYDLTEEDLAEISNFPMSVMDELTDAAMEVSGLRPEAVEEAKKKSKPTRS